MGYWVRFRLDGVPDAFSGAHFPGAEWIENATSTLLETCYRNKQGIWMVRDPEPEDVAVPPDEHSS